MLSELSTAGINLDQEVFNEKSVKIAGKQKIGLVGSSGSGKSTFANLIIRLYDVNSGQILIDGQDISKVTQDSLRQNISFIPQEPLLFHRTIMENIRYGKKDASDEEYVNESEWKESRSNCDERRKGTDGIRMCRKDQYQAKDEALVARAQDRTSVCGRQAAIRR